MKSLTEPELRARIKAAIPEQRELTARWRTLQEQVKPVLAPEALVLAVALGASLLVSGFLQFFTGAYEAHIVLSVLSALVNTTLAVAIALMVLMRRPWDRPHYMVMLAAAAIVALSVGSVGAKLHYQRGLTGNAFYSLPHYATKYPAPSETVWLTTSDNVRIAGTMIAGGHRKAVLIVPPWRANRDAFSVATLAQWLSNSYDVLVIDPRGQGESAGAKTPDGAEKFDVIAGVNYLRSTGHEKVAVLAEQDGAYAAMLAGTMHAGIDSLALMSPSSSWGESLGQTGKGWDPAKLWGRLYWRVVAGMRLGSSATGPAPIEAVRMVAPTPVLFIGTKTEIGSTVDTMHLSADEPKSLIVLGADKGRPTSWAHFAEYYEAVKQWFDFSLVAVGDSPLK